MRNLRDELGNAAFKLGAFDLLPVDFVLESREL
jgi:hypothetical protein